jgi:hypothetical protein
VNIRICLYSNFVKTLNNQLYIENKPLLIKGASKEKSENVALEALGTLSFDYAQGTPSNNCPFSELPSNNYSLAERSRSNSRASPQLSNVGVFGVI